jgi:poly(3-hydroxybutyrate) depolymerase
MKRGPGRGRIRAATKPYEALPLIVFHGDQDDTVHPGNGEELIVRTRFLLPGSAAEAATERTRTVEGRVPGGRAWTRTLHQDTEGHCHAEHWVIHGSGHAWSGGHPAGSYTDPHGPDASREMLRFFRQHRRQSLTPRSSDARPAFHQVPSDVLGPQHPPQPVRPLRRR